MSSSSSEDRFWDSADVTDYARLNYLDFYIPTVVSVIVWVVISIAVVRQHTTSTKIRIKSANSHRFDQEDEDGVVQDLHERHFSILTFTGDEPKYGASTTVITRGFIEKSRVIVECMLNYVQVAVSIYVLCVHSGRLRTRNCISQAFLWLLLSSVVTLRLMNINQSIAWINRLSVDLWKVSFASYTSLMIPSVLTYRSIWLGHVQQSMEKKLYSEQFYVITLLLSLSLFASIRNSCPAIYTPDKNTIASPEPTTSIISFITWTWVEPFIWSSYRKGLKFENIWGLVLEDYSFFSVRRFKSFLAKQHRRSHFSYKLLRFFATYLVIQSLWALLSGCIIFLPSLLLKKILEFIDSSANKTTDQALTYVIGMFFIRVFVSICKDQISFLGKRVSVRMRSILLYELYTKVLKRRSYCVNTKDETDKNTLCFTQGAVLSLMSVDASRVADISNYLHAFIEASVMITVALILLYQLLGFASLLGTAMIIILLPINFQLTRLLGKYQLETLTYTDKRTSKLNELFQTIRIVKYFAWEGQFSDAIHKLRRIELRKYLKKSAIWSLSSFVWFLNPTLVTTVSFAFYVLYEKRQLTASVAFTALSLFTFLKVPLDQIAYILNLVIQSKASLKRIEAYLNEADTKKYLSLTVDELGEKLAFEDATLTWNKSQQTFTLKNISIDFKIGELNLIIGPTGSGKTTLLMGLLGELDLLGGRVIVPSLEPMGDMLVEADGYTNSIAYCAQDAWLMNETIRNNIVFNSEFDEQRYNAVINACALKRDYEILQNGDQTLVGENGITLSGGQKQRISLARALYSRARTILLDDCLSAIDAHTSSWIYDNALTGPLVRGRTRILVSHNAALTVHKAALIVVLEEGIVRVQGSAKELMATGIFSRESFSCYPSKDNPEQTTTTGQTGQDHSLDEPAYSSSLSTNENDDVCPNKEEKAYGATSVGVYRWYFANFGGWKMVSILGSLFFLSQNIALGQSWWVRYWANSSPSTSNDTYLSIYFMIGMSYSLLCGIKSMLCAYAGTRASKKIFIDILDNTLNAQIEFFDTTPVGQIMNRFSKDIGSVDQELVPYIEGTMTCIVQGLSTILVIVYITPKFLFFGIVIAALCCLFGYVYLSSSRELKRFENITRSPLYQHFSESLTGSVTIRAYGQEPCFISKILGKIDDNNRPFFYLWVANCWLSFRIEILGSLVVFGSGIFVILSLGEIDSGMAGISLTNAISFTECTLWMVKFYATVEMTMNSVERLEEYTHIKQEQMSEKEPTGNWPERGAIKVCDLSLRYSPALPKVINNISFDVEAGSKVGIVGRTGAGKSTIITAFFRFLEAENGYIEIDGVNIKDINLQRLRRSITIIPQIPTLFAGTIRSNLDPYQEYSDDEISEALRRVNLNMHKETSTTTPGTSVKSSCKFQNLDYNVAENGENFSQGQRQLLCLARSLLKNTKIILLDEATASIDYETDAMLQETIRAEFSESTVLAIAHRLKSIIDYDKVLVMDAGEVREYDHPYALLCQKDSMFYSMCEQSGELATLIDIAKSTFSKQ